jgi:hypothetical protein
MVPPYPSFRRHFAGGEAPSSGAGGAPDYRQKLTKPDPQFANLEYLISLFQARASGFLFISCANMALSHKV